jgi:hypothetical protein
MVDSRLSLAPRFIADRQDSFKEHVNKLLTKDAAARLSKQGCMPLFLLVKHGAAVGTIFGADAPMLLQLSKQFMPELVKAGDE